MGNHVDHQYAEFGGVVTLPEFERWVIEPEGEAGDPDDLGVDHTSPQTLTRYSAYSSSNGGEIINTKDCIHCKSPIPEEATKCPECGGDVNPAAAAFAGIVGGILVGILGGVLVHPFALVAIPLGFAYSFYAWRNL